MFRVPSPITNIITARDDRATDICQSRSSFNQARRITALALACSVLAACSISGGGADLQPTDTLVTSSVAKPAEAEGVASTDAELIKTVVADAGADGSLAWQNPDTGNKGTITAINGFIGENGQQCKKFQTTVDTFMGISLYNGETCELKKGFWVLSWFLRQDT